MTHLMSHVVDQRLLVVCQVTRQVVHHLVPQVARHPGITQTL